MNELFTSYNWLWQDGFGTLLDLIKDLQTAIKKIKPNQHTLD